MQLFDTVCHLPEQIRKLGGNAVESIGQKADFIPAPELELFTEISFGNFFGHAQAAIQRLDDDPLH